MSAKIKILIVEDQALVAQSLSTTLQDLGYEVFRTCYTYADALEAIAQPGIDLALIDINLRDADFRNNGLRLASKIPAELPFLFLTGYADIEMIRDATILKPHGYLIKPVMAASLFGAIQTALARTQYASLPAAPAEEEELATESQPDFFFVKINSERRKIFWKDIAFITTGKNYVKLRVAGNNQEYPIRGTLTFVLEQLLPENLRSTFVRIGRAVSINRFLVTSYDLEEVVCDGHSFENTRVLLREMHDLFGNKAYTPQPV